MEAKEPYGHLLAGLKAIADPAMAGLLADMEASDSKRFQAYAAALNKAGNANADLGYQGTLAFLDALKAENPKWAKGIGAFEKAFDVETYRQSMADWLCDRYYALLYWLLVQLHRLYDPCHQLEILLAAFAPVLENAKTKALAKGPYAEAFKKVFLKKPDPELNGYASATTFLFLSGNDTAQTILTRMGKCLWDSLYPMDSLYYSRNGEGAVSALSLSAIETETFTGKEIVDFVPLMVFLGFEVDWTEANGAKGKVSFPFDPVEAEDISVSLDGKGAIVLDYLDDLTKKGIGDPTPILDRIREAAEVRFQKPIWA